VCAIANEIKYADFLSTVTNENAQRSITIANDLHFWAVYRSRTFCQDCGSLDKIKLMPSFQSKLPVKWIRLVIVKISDT
jgi:hypothetical protein